MSRDTEIIFIVVIICLILFLCLHCLKLHKLVVNSLLYVLKSHWLFVIEHRTQIVLFQVSYWIDVCHKEGEILKNYAITDLLQVGLLIGFLKYNSFTLPYFSYVIFLGGKKNEEFTMKLNYYLPLIYESKLILHAAFS